jgi:hypothetical protein
LTRKIQETTAQKFCIFDAPKNTRIHQDIFNLRSLSSLRARRVERTKTREKYMNTFLPNPTFVEENLPLDHHRTRSLLQPSAVSDFPARAGQLQQQQHQQRAFFFASSPRVRLLVNGKDKFVASTHGCSSVADFVSKKLNDIEMLRGREVKVTLGDDFELIGSSPISILGQDEVVCIKTTDGGDDEEEEEEEEDKKKTKNAKKSGEEWKNIDYVAKKETEEEEEEEEEEKERFYSDSSESEEEETASEEGEEWKLRRSDANGGISGGEKMCGHVMVNRKVCQRIAGECSWHSKGKVRKERESEDRDEEDVICALCDKGTYPSKLVLCDACDQGYHTFCYGLESVPKGDWVCASCVIKRKKAQPRLPAVLAKNPRNKHIEKKKVSPYATHPKKSTHSPTTSKRKRASQSGVKTNAHTLSPSKSGVSKRKKKTKVNSTVSLAKRCDQALRELRAYIKSLGGALSYNWKCSCTVYGYGPCFLYSSPNGATFRSRKAVARFLGFDV